MCHLHTHTQQSWTEVHIFSDGFDPEFSQSDHRTFAFENKFEKYIQMNTRRDNGKDFNFSIENKAL